MKIISLILIAVLTAIDQLIKMLVVTYLKPIGSKTVITNLLQLKYLENTGASFGIGKNFGWLFIIITVLLSGVIIYLLLTHQNHNAFSYYSAIAITAGGIGNLIDRLFFGYVIDYIYVMFFPYIFNFADCLVVTGVIAYVIYFVFYFDKVEKLKEKSEL